MAALSRFISRLGERVMPFFKLLKKVDGFQWTPEAQEAFDDLKKFLTMPSVLKSPNRATANHPAEDLLLYLSCTTHVVSTALVVERMKETHTQPTQHLVYFISAAHPKYGTLRFRSYCMRSLLLLKNCIIISRSTKLW